ncbi:hypothetical protein Tco_1038435 [Tanacetum coccineum]
MENANPSCSTSNREFLDPKKKKEIESWLKDSRIVDSLDGSNEIEYFNTFPTMEELEYLVLGWHNWFKVKVEVSLGVDLALKVSKAKDLILGKEEVAL